MTKGELALVLHAHLPYVRSAESGSLEEDWYFQALMECYLPLIETLENSAKDPQQNPKLTLGLSPTLLSLITDEELNSRFPDWLNLRLKLLSKVSSKEKLAAEYLAKKIEIQILNWNIELDLVNRFKNLNQLGIIDILTCAATHGYLPLLRESSGAIRGQLNTAVKEHNRIFNTFPLGIWLPECAYYEGLDVWMKDAGLKYAILDGHGLLHACPRPRYGIYAPICTKNGVAFFGRDSDSTLPVWSAKDGYPGDPYYREFHKDIGWELSQEELKDLGLKDSRPLGLKLYRVTDPKTPINSKEVYEPSLATSRTKEHAKEYLKSRRIQLDQLNQSMPKSPLLVAPFDAELFGHWWFEGPDFLAELFKQANKEKVALTRLCDVLSNNPKIQLCEPCPSSWGKGGFHDYWVNDSNSWLVPKWSEASRAFIETCNSKIEESKLDLLKQAGKELLLAQSSDWSFILRAGTTTELAKERIEIHLERFWMIIGHIKKEIPISEEWVKRIEIEDSIFPLIDPKDWANLDH